MLFKVKIKAEVIIICPDFEPDDGKCYEDFKTDGNSQIILLMAEQHINDCGLFETEDGKRVGVRVHFQDSVLGI